MTKPIKLNDKSNIMKVVELGLQNRIFEAMKKPKFSAEAITRELNGEGIDITSQSIRKFIKKSQKAQQELIQKDLKIANQYVQLAMDYQGELKTILDEVKEVKSEARLGGDLASYNQLVGRLMQGIELIAKLTGDIKPKGSIDVTVIYNEINNDVQTAMNKMKNEIFKSKTIDIDYEIVEEDKELAEQIQKGED